MSSIKEILESGIKNLQDAACFLEDIMTLREQYKNVNLNIVNPNSVSNRIITQLYTRTVPGTSLISTDSLATLSENPDLFPLNMKFMTSTGALENGHGEAIWGCKITTEAPENPIDLLNIKEEVPWIRKIEDTGEVPIAIQYNCNYNGKRASILGDTLPHWITLTNITPLMKIINTKYKIPITENNIGIYYWPNAMLFEFVFTNPLDEIGVSIFSKDLWSFSKFYGIYTSFQYALDKWGRVIFIAPNAVGMVRLLDDEQNIYYPDNMINYNTDLPSISGINGLYASQDYSMIYATTSNGYNLEITENTETDGAERFDVPACVHGSIYINRQVIELKHLGFVPDKVFISWDVDPSVATPPQYTNMLFSTCDDLLPEGTLAISFHKLSADSTGTVVKTSAANNETKFSGYISGDGFVIHLPVDYLWTTCKYIAFGKAAGNDPYMS